MSRFIQQDHRHSGGPQHALDVVAAQQAEYDSRRLRRLNDETGPLTAGYEENLLQHSPTDLRFLTSDRHAADRSIDALESGRAEFDGALPFERRFRLAVQTEFARYANVTMPVAISPEGKQAIAGHGGLYQIGPSQLLETITENQRRDPRPQKSSDLQNTNDPIAQFAPRYATLPNVQNSTAVPQHASTATGDEFTRPSAQNQTSGKIRLQTETNSDERPFPFDIFQRRGNDRDIRSLHVPYQGALTDGMISSEPAFDRAVDAPAIDFITANLGTLIAQRDGRTICANTPTNFDRDGGHEIDGGPFSNPATNHSAQDALAAATEEVERLTAAVRRTIQELDRARGSVQSALPALPFNFGSFRL